MWLTKHYSHLIQPNTTNDWSWTNKERLLYTNTDHAFSIDKIRQETLGPASWKSPLNISFLQSFSALLYWPSSCQKPCQSPCIPPMVGVADMDHGWSDREIYVTPVSSCHLHWWITSIFTFWRQSEWLIAISYSSHIANSLLLMVFLIDE